MKDDDLGDPLDDPLEDPQDDPLGDEDFTHQAISLPIPELDDQDVEVILDSIELAAPNVDPGAIGSYRESRVRALSRLYEISIKNTVVADRFDDSLANLLVDGVLANLEQINLLIEQANIDWGLERMPVIDQVIAKIAVFELLKRRETSVAVILDEAIDLANRFSTESSARFINGILASIASTVRAP
jgi:N utilization substance protein B